MEVGKLTARLQEIFSVIIEDGDLSRIQEFYTDDYVETINGKERTLNDLQELIKNRKNEDEVSIIQISFVENANVVGSMHQLLLKDNANGCCQKGNVISVFTFDKDKLSKCSEVLVFEKPRRHIGSDENDEDDEDDKYNYIYE